MKLTCLVRVLGCFFFVLPAAMSSQQVGAELQRSPGVGWSLLRPHLRSGSGAHLARTAKSSALVLSASGPCNPKLHEQDSQTGFGPKLKAWLEGKMRIF